LSSFDLRPSTLGAPSFVVVFEFEAEKLVDGGVVDVVGLPTFADSLQHFDGFMGGGGSSNPDSFFGCLEFLN
jgi:hypothetical protein